MEISSDVYEKFSVFVDITRLDRIDKVMCVYKS